MTSCNHLLTFSNVPEARQLALQRDLCRNLVEIGISASRAESSVAQGIRGDAVTAGQIVLGLISSGSVVALISCLKAYIQRESRITFTIKSQRGDLITFDAKNIEAPTIESLLIRVLDSDVKETS